IVRQQQFFHARDLGGSVRHGGTILTRHQHMHWRRNRHRRRHRPGGGFAQHLVVMLGDDKRAHFSAPASTSLSTNSATLLTLMPAVRGLGSLTFSTLQRGVTSTPSSAGVFSAMGFFFAFMMLGSEA